MASPARLNNNDYGERLATLEASTGRLDRLEKLPETMAAMQRDVENLKDKVDSGFDDVRGQIKAVSESIDKLGAKLEERQDKTSKRVSGVEATLAHWKTMLKVAALAAVLTAPKWVVEILKMF